MRMKRTPKAELEAAASDSWLDGAPSKPIPSHAANVGVWKIRPELRSGVKMQSVSG